MKSTNKEFADYLYNRLPKMYRSSDKEFLLERFIQSFAEGGFNPLLQETMNIMDLLDVDKCPSKFLPQLCKMYGYEYTLEIPELFQRRLLKYIVEMYKRKGTKSVVRFIARELTGFDSEIIENKDFNEEHISLTKWDIRFEHYRNFILKLTAPYEDSNLFNKEDIVIKIVNDFLPTNSQVFVITAYWFKEESEIVKNSIEHCVMEAIEDYTGSFNSETVKKSDLQESFTKLFIPDSEYNYAFYGEEDSYLNYPIEGMKLMTNTVVNIRDTVKMATEIYNNFLSTMESLEVNTLLIEDSEIVDNLLSYTYTDKQRLTLLVESFDYLAPTLYDSTDVTRESTHLEESNIDRNGEFYRLGRIKDIFFEEDNQSTRTKEADYVIIKPVIEENTYNLMQRNLLDNSKLNTGLLFTNGIMSFDVIKQKGQPDTIILL